jgi:cytochrome c5
MDTLVEHAINGYQGSAGYMPPKGGRADLSDDAIKAAVEYMAENSK